MPVHKTIELLAPARNLQTGIAAITHGADAVYIAADKFGAREKASNSLEDIEKLCNFAHQYFAKVYATVNTIIFEGELKEVQGLINKLNQAKVDAIIIQDFSILAMDIPPIPIHASTQMHNSTVEKLKFLEQCGIERAVLPRELSLKEIEYFRNSTNIELEVFVHGALCVSHSGQCYMSQAITGRSANRGECAQLCRSKYDLIDAKGKILVRGKHLLSLKDLNLSQYIHQLLDAGVSSFKIEGRLKDISYVKNTTAYYSSLINSIISSKPNYRRSSSGKCRYNFTPDLERSFNRGFTQHFIGGRTENQASIHTQKSTGKLIGKVVKVGASWFAVESTEQIVNGDGLCYFNGKGELTGFPVNSTVQEEIYPSQTQEGIAIGTLIYRNFDHTFEKLLRGNSATRYLSVSISVKQKDGKLYFEATDEDSVSTSIIIDDTFENADNHTLARERMANQLSKSGNTIFKVDSISTIDIRNAKHIPVSALNLARRQLLDNLLKERIRERTVRKRGIVKPGAEYPYPKIDYKGNVANSWSKNFLYSHGVKGIDNAFEVEQPQKHEELMVSHYCIKYEIGLCPSKQNAKSTNQLFLRDNKFTYPLTFDCTLCQMKVFSPIKNKL